MEPPETPVVDIRAPHRVGVARHSPAHHGQEEDNRELKSDEASQKVFPDRASTPARKAPSLVFCVSSGILSHAVKRSNRPPLPDRYLRTQSTPPAWLLSFHEGRCSSGLSANDGPFMNRPKEPAYVSRQLPVGGIWMTP